MENREHIFHLAVPCADLDRAAAFYGALPGCRVARRYADRVTVDFFGDQLVCHLSPEDVDPDPRMYPRHFGVTFREKSDFDAVLEAARRDGLAFFREPFERFAGKPEAHATFFLRDPSNNLIEFKWYADARYIY